MVDVESNRESLVEEDDPLVEEDDLIVQLWSLKHVSHIRSYIEAFDELNSRAGIEEDQALSVFLSRLVDEIRVPVCMFEPKTLAEAYALSKLQELTITGVFWCDRKERHEDEVDYSTKDSIRNPTLKTEWKLDSEMEDETYADEEIDPDAEIDVFEEEEADWDYYIEKEIDVTTTEIASDTAIQTEMDQSAAYVEAATEVLMECSLDSAHWDSKSLQNTQIQIYRDQSFPDPQIEDIEVKAAMEGEVADMKKVDKDSWLAGLMQSEGKKKEMGEALRRFGNRSSDCTMIVRVWQASVWNGEVKMKHMVVSVDSCIVFKGGGMTRVAYRQVQRGEVIGGNLGKQIDLDMESASIRQLKIFQYRDENLNKTIEHFYVHFGQRLGRFFTNGVYGQFESPQLRDMLNCFGVGRLLTVTGGLITYEGAGAFSFVNDWKEQGLSLEFISSDYDIVLMDLIVTALGLVYDDSNNKP
ncbi:uncharacterized protein LOC121771308 [Salvia splendens]|uniref:uncharacterized protein LOC121771308 n=1 Tax=Salvia splendens TaxID=180675 RepID=UPI001C255709|nr:uncharacterized protein LOC121771308 [Salvia splendens]XP_042024025.1 uncharacterized protein LOC121771308 [Salvia splendens]XP_042024026.1 uncharacterized protein LOC121771308 [Salvia splendens]